MSIFINNSEIRTVSVCTNSIVIFKLYTHFMERKQKEENSSMKYPTPIEMHNKPLITIKRFYMDQSFIQQPF